MWLTCGKAAQHKRAGQDKHGQKKEPELEAKKMLNKLLEY